MPSLLLIDRKYSAVIYFFSIVRRRNELKESQLIRLTVVQPSGLCRRDSGGDNCHN